jgi:3-oxoacyl-[acyl-carrier-protein] synthase-1
MEAARARSAVIHAEVLGWGEAADGYNVMAPEPDGGGLARAMENALAESGVEKERVDYINAHATGTPAGDVSEVRAIRRVFASRPRPYISSTKALTGHGLCLSGALEAALTVLALEEKFMPVSANITQLDPACGGVSILTEPVDLAPEIALSNSSGFGGANVTLVLGRFTP